MIWRTLTRSTALATVASLTSGKIYFSETFDDEWEKRWVQSEEQTGHPRGYFELDVGKNFTRDYMEDRGLFTPEYYEKRTEAGPSPDRMFAISAHFEPFSNRKKSLYIQFSVKVDNTANGCYGPAIMLGPPMQDPKRFDRDTPYYLRFGPDFCSTLDSKELRKLTAVEFTMDDRPIAKTKAIPFFQDVYHITQFHQNHITHLYRLTIKPDNIIRVEIDNIQRYKGPMHRGWEFFEESRYIPDVEDEKPEDWPEEYQYRGTKPAYWVDEEMMPVPGATQPDDWDEEEDGVWGAPMKKNPEYKGEWKPDQYTNPRYKGEWKPRMVKNPVYELDEELYMYEDIGFVGFKFVDRHGGTLIDNVILADKKSDLDEFTKKYEKMRKHEDKMIWMEELDEDDRELEIFQNSDFDLRDIKMEKSEF